MIPVEIENYETYVVSYSGGKDSTATLLWGLEHLPRERLQVVFADTTVEWPETYEYLGYIERELGVTIDRVQAGDRPIPVRADGTKRHDLLCYETTLLGLIRRRGKWPGAVARYCNLYLKRWPLRLYANEYPNPIWVEGTRREESHSRSKLEHLQLDFKLNPFGNTMRPVPIYRPILYWSEREVWNYLRAHRILPNPVYNYATRCGCWCCIMAPKVQILNFCKLHPVLAQKAADLEQEIGHTWKEGESISNLLARARAQLELFTTTPRFENPLESTHGQNTK